MKAIRVVDEKVPTVVQLDPVELAPKAVRIEVEACGICGTDLRRISVGLADGLIPGHEFAGTIAEVGAAVDDWSPGDRVAVCPFLTCGECEPCRAGESVVHCEREGVDWNWSGGTKDGGFATTVDVDPAQLVRVPDSLPLAHAALAEPLACGIHAAVIARIDSSSSAVVIGAGPIGVLTVLALQHRGVERIVVVQRSEARRRFVEQHLGVPAVGLDRAADAVAANLDGPADIAFDCSGNREAITLAFGLIPTRSEVIATGISAEPFSVEPFGLVVRERRVLGCAAYSVAEFAEAVAALSETSIDLETLVTSEIGLDEVPETIATLLAGGRREDLKILIRPRG